MQQIFDLDPASTQGNIGTLPVQGDDTAAALPDSGTEFSFLMAFVSDSLDHTTLGHAKADAESDGHKLETFIEHHSARGEGGKSAIKKPLNGIYTGDTGNWDEFRFDLTPFGGGNTPNDFSLNDPSIRVEIIGQISLADWWSFDSITLLANEPGLYPANNPANQEEPPPKCPGEGNRVDWNFIRGREGHELKGYILTDNNGVLIGKGGVTIASGFDLGVRSLYDLNKMGLSPSLVSMLTPYLGKTMETAASYLATHPLLISAEDANSINTATHSLTLASLVAQYDNATSAGAFWKLDGAAQTVIASVAFQYGNLATRTPNFWHQVTHNQWSEAVANLKNFGDGFKDRRVLEAELLASKLVNGNLPSCH